MRKLLSRIDLARPALARIAFDIRLSVFDSGLVVYFLDFGDLHTTALVSGDRVIGGAVLSSERIGNAEWYTVQTLWSEKAVGAVTLLYSVLEHYGRILPSKNISPAALSVVKRFYTKYRGTEVVVEGVNGASGLDELSAGYVWSPSRLRKVPVQLGKVETREQAEQLKGAVALGFQSSYSDPKRTKFNNPDDFLIKGDYRSLYELLIGMLEGSDSSKALGWINDNIEELRDIRDKYTKKLVEIYSDQVDTDY